jgi:hypothetical protein
VADAAWLKRVPSVVKLVVTFHIVCVTWLLFRAESMTQAWGMALRLFQDWRWTSLSAYTLVMVLLLAGPLMLLEAWIERRGGVLAITRSPWLARALIYLALLLAILYFAPERTSEFIYFQF